MREQVEVTCVYSIAGCGVPNGAFFLPFLHLLSQLFKLINHTFKLIPSHLHDSEGLCHLFLRRAFLVERFLKLDGDKLGQCVANLLLWAHLMS